MKFVCILVFIVFSFLSTAQSKDSCRFIVLDHQTGKILPFANVVTRTRLLYSDSIGIFHIQSTYNDSIWISLPGYSPILTKYNKDGNMRDTFYLFPNIYELSPVKIIGKNYKKRYKIGKRNRNWDMEWYVRRQCSLESYIPNNFHKRSRIIKGYLFLVDHNRGENPNIMISLYKVKKGKVGSLIAKNITLEPQSNNKKSGWFKLEINSNIHIPRSGFYVVISKKENTMNQVGIGLIELKYTKGNTYFYCYSDRKHKESVNKYFPYKHYGIKMYFIIKG